ncbi:hypothetical protein HPC62_06155 [Thermoleptolyngbya sichuanensis A183]|jgi:hypothetical protein|uniref:Uncharacterized protein n=1 Tax=Thermoleptolyngbya sichuanensis A183 TaxID=2737172 RepID=A0A6M8B233_9CYAN|nr:MULTISPECIES: hypothetical protein [Thermoleptolyngbya]QKD80754.1 hypothetical protein HPC62_06155 [Thermoleptolyngbya sichuanensis A183]HIK40230.1 hypothetical protein [Thermoleptolyngbya sp. M55_K2018_002]
MHDNKVRLSADVLEKAQQIAAEWGLKNTRAAVEAVFRRYADDYLHGREPFPGAAIAQTHLPTWTPPRRLDPLGLANGGSCEALDALDELLGA